MDARAAALAYLEAHHVMTLATSGPDGPWAAAVFYASQGFDLCFLSSPRSRHAGHLASGGRAAASIQEDYRDWREIRGIQLEGAVSELTGAERDAARRAYADKFAFLREAAGLPASIAQALDRVRWYRLRPDRLYFVDNTVAFGHRSEIGLP